VTPPFRRDRFTWLAYILLAFYGYYLNILGPITPFLKEELALSYTVSSLHFTAFAVGILLMGLGGHPLVQRVGRGPALWIGALGISIGALLLLLAGQSPVDAARAVSLFLAAMIVGRLAGSRLVHRLAAQRVLMASILVAGAGFTAF